MSTSTITKKNHPNNAPTLMLMLVSMLVGIFAFINVYSIQSILPTMMNEFNISADKAGQTVAITVLAIAIISPFIGMLSDAIGRKFFIVASVLLLSIPTILIGFAHNINEILLYRFIQGLLVPGMTVVMMAYLGEEFKGRIMTKLISLYVSGSVLGGFLGRFVTGHLEELLGWREAFWTLGALNFISALIIIFYLPNSKCFEANRNIKKTLSTLGNHLKNPNLLAACCTGGCVFFSLVGGFTYINIYLAKEPFSLTSAQLANIFIVYLLGTVVTPLASRLIQRFGPRGTILLALSISSLGILGTLSSHLWVIIIGLAVLSTGVFITQSSTISFVTSRITEGRSLATGLYNMSYYFGGTLGAVVCGMTFIWGGWLATAIALLIAQLMSMSIAARFMKTKNPDIVH